MESLPLTSVDETITITLDINVDPDRDVVTKGTVIDVNDLDAANAIELVSGEYYTLVMKRTDTGDYPY